MQETFNAWSIKPEKKVEIFQIFVLKLLFYRFKKEFPITLTH